MGHRRARGQQSELITVLDGETEIQEKAQTLDRFANQFDRLLNMTGEVDGSALDIIAQRPNITLVDEKSYGNFRKVTQYPHFLKKYKRGTKENF